MKVRLVPLPFDLILRVATPSAEEHMHSPSPDAVPPESHRRANVPNLAGRLQAVRRDKERVGDGKRHSEQGPAPLSERHIVRRSINPSPKPRRRGRGVGRSSCPTIKIPLRRGEDQVTLLQVSLAACMFGHGCSASCVAGLLSLLYHVVACPGAVNALLRLFTCPVRCARRHILFQSGKHAFLKTPRRALRLSSPRSMKGCRMRSPASVDSRGGRTSVLV